MPSWSAIQVSLPRFKPRTYVSGQNCAVREVCLSVVRLGFHRRLVPSFCFLVVVQPRVGVPQKREHRLEDGKQRGQWVLEGQVTADGVRGDALL